MRGLIITLQMLVRILFLALVGLGIAFWTGNALGFIQLHMALGVALVVCLWTMSIAAMTARVPTGMAVSGIVLGIVVIALGATQMSLLTGSLHWLVEVGHLLVGMVAIGL